MLAHLIYRSRAIYPTGHHTDLDILRTALMRNGPEGVTGFLLRTPASYAQALEGDRATIEALFARIAQDKRHSDISVLHDCNIERRLFADWSMALARRDIRDTTLWQATGNQVLTMLLDASRADDLITKAS